MGRYSYVAAGTRITDTSIGNFCSIGARCGIGGGAEYVVTDSFHGTALSINFRKNFFCCNRRGYEKKTSYSSRLTNLLHVLGFEDRQVTEGNWHEDREVFRDKVRFNTTFSDYIGREWVLIDQKDPEAIAEFIRRHGSIIVKPRFCDSGKDIAFFDSDAATTVTEQDLIKKYSGFLAEEILVNHDDIKALNPSSLNTIRIITIVTKEDVEFLYAGIRIGAPDLRVDNISMGGKVAAINLNTGEIESGFQSKTTSEVQFKVDDFTGKRIPCWEELLRFVKSAARMVPGVRYVAWDVAITPKGPALIEGNHSSGNTITQASIDINSPGLRPRLEEILKKC